MKTKSTLFSKLKEALLVLALSTGLAVQAQAPIQGGTTYVVNGSGVDLVAPKDTFVNLMGAYAGGAYSAATGIFNAITVNGVDPNTIGTITILLAPGYTGVEPAQIQLGSASVGAFNFMSPLRPIVVRPSSGNSVVITTSAGLAANISLVKFNGVGFVTFDGESSPGQRNLTLQLNASSTQATSKVVEYSGIGQNGCQNITVKNCIVTGNSTVNAINTYAGFYVGGTAPPSNPTRRSQNLVIENNIIQAVRHGVYARGIGNAANSHDIGLTVRNNIIGGTTPPNAGFPTTYIGGVANAAGVVLVSQLNALVEGNTIRNSLIGFGGFRAIELSAGSGNLSIDSNITINANKIYNLYTNVTSLGIHGIRANLGVHAFPANISITNNTIGKIAAIGSTGAVTTFNYTSGIVIEDNSTNAGYSIHHNSIFLSGDSLPAAGVSTCIGMSASVQGGVELTNNILANTMDRLITATGNPTTSYAIVTAGVANPFSLATRNAYYLTDERGGYAAVGFARSRNRFTVQEWAQYSGATNELMAIPPFVGNDDSTLTIANGAGSTLSNAGLFVGVSGDINGVARPSSNPSIGAYQFSGNSALAFFPLVGGRTYAINGINNRPLGAGGNGSFATLTDAVEYLNHYGVTGTGSVRLQIEPGYPKESKFIPAVIDFAGAAATRPVIITIAPTHNDTISTPNVPHFTYTSVLRFLGARHIQIDGAGLPGERNLTFTLATLGNNVFNRVISITSTDTSSVGNIEIRNAILQGNSTTTAINTFAGIYHGSYFPPSVSNTSSAVGNNNNITIENNIIQAVRNGVFVRGANLAGQQNFNWRVSRNIIGGDIAPGGSLPTTYIGGNTSTATEQSGVMFKSVMISQIDSNIIRNTVATTTASNQFAGIRLDALGEQAIDSAITIRNNFIYNLTTTSGQAMYGIRIDLLNATERVIRILNNSIAKIRSTGAGAAANINNPAGIFISASAVVTNLGVQIYNNTVNLTGTSLTSNSSSSCLFINSTVQGGLDVRNNAFTNGLGRNIGLAGSAFAVNVVSNINPFTLPFGNIAFNAYGVNAPNSQNFVAATSNGTVTYPSIASWRAFTTLDPGSVNYAPIYATDSLPTFDISLAGALYNGAQPLALVPRDIFGNARPTAATCIGAVQFVQTFAPLTGGNTYLINGIQDPPTVALPSVGSFATINKAIQYINANGVDGFAANQPITLLIAGGYQGEGDTLISALTDYPKMNANRVITLRPGSGRNDTITLSPAAAASLLGNNSSLFRFLGGSHFTIDGSNNGTNSRNLTFLMPSNITNNTVKVIDLSPLNEAVQNVTIRNCNIVGQSTTSAINTFAGIYMGGLATTPSNPPSGNNNNNKFINNFIGAVRYGIYARGASVTGNQQDFGTVIQRNIIGGDIPTGAAVPTTYIGGVANASGILLSAQGGSLIDSNVVRNTLVGNFNTYSGIELSNISGTQSVDTNITISRNHIYNIRNTVASGGAAYGVRMSLGNASERAIRFHNNAIAKILSSGTASATTVSVVNPIGILIDATGTINNIGVDFFYNSINLGPANTLVNTATSASVMFGTGVRGGVRARNNIFQNTLGASSGLAKPYSIVIGSNFQIFSEIDNNGYFVGATNATNRLGAFNASATPSFINTLDDARTINLQDTNSVNFVVPFMNDSMPIISDGAATAVYGGAAILSNVTTDIRGNARSFALPCIGANEFIGTYPDSVAPLVYDLTPASDCSNGPFQITLRVIERNVATDTLYYSVNGGADIPLTGPVVNGFTRTFTIPAQSANTSLTYRYSVRDGSPFAYSAVSPASGRTPISTIFSNFPITFGFDLPNTQGWTVEQVSGNGGWDLNSFGSPNLPILGPQTGLRAALFPAQTLPVGTTSRLVSPCLDFTDMQQPTVRIWMSQNSDVPNSRDSINFRVTAGGGFWSFPLRSFNRVNTSLAFPGYTQYDICLNDFVGISGLRFALEAVSRGGNNIVLDSIVVFDDRLNLAITPSAGTVCTYDSVTLTLPGTSNRYTYKMIDVFDNSDFTNTVTGNNGSIVLKGWHNNADSVYLRGYYTNLLSGCSNFMNDTIKAFVRKFSNGPFVSPGVPFNGNFAAGTLVNPDGARPGDVLTYRITPPSGLTNSQFGSAWTIVGNSVQTVNGSVPNSVVYTAPSGAGNGSYVITPSGANIDSLYRMTLTIRLLPSGCDSVITRWIKIASPPSASFINGNDTVCALVSKTFVNTSSFAPQTAPVTALWNWGDGNTSTTFNASHVFATGGTYTVTLTVTNNAGISSSFSKQIFVRAAPEVSFANGLVCAGSGTQFSNTSVGSVSNVWEFIINGNIENTVTATNTNYSFLLGDTTYTVKLTGTNAQGCANSALKQVYVFPKPVAEFTTSTHCLGVNAPITNQSFILTAKPNNTFGSEWDFGNGQTALSNQPAIRYNTSGTYNLKLKVFTNFGCVDSISKSVVVQDKPIIDFTIANPCQFSPLVINNNSTYSGGLSKVQFGWDFGDNSNIVNDVTPSKTYGAVGTYNVKLTAIDTVNFCRDSVTRTITINERPFASFNVVTQNCVGTPIPFGNISTAPTGQTLTYTWDFKDGNTSTATNPTHTYTAAGEYAVLLTATTNVGCSGTKEVVVSATQAPTVTFTETEVDGPFSGKFIFTASPAGLANYRWNFGDNTGDQNKPTADAFEYRYANGGNYNVRLSATDANGCVGDTVTRSVSSKVGSNELLAAQYNLNIAPNPFTTNTNIMLTLEKSANVSVTVFDMLGKKVMEMNKGQLNAGSQSIEINSANFNSTASAYLVKIEIDGQTLTRSIIQQR